MTRIRPRLTLAHATAALLLLTLPALASLSDDVFGGLRAELEHRRDDDLAGELDRAGRKQLKSVEKSLTMVTESDDALSGVARTAGKVDKSLRKAFKDEFAAGAESHLASLPALLAGIADDLEGRIGDQLDAVDNDVQQIEGKAATTVERFSGKARKQFAKSLAAADDDNAKKRLKGLFKAARIAEKAVLVIDRALQDDPGGGGEPGGTFIRADLDGQPWSATGIESLLTGGLLLVSGQGDLGDDITRTLDLQVNGVTGPGTFPLDGESGTLRIGPTALAAVSGSLTLTVLDGEAGLLVGTVSGTFSDGETTVVLTNGTLRLEDLRTE